MTTGLVEFELVLRSGIDIHASPEAVWTQLARLQEWKRSVVSCERLAGEPGAVGELLRVGQRPSDVTVHMLMRTLRAEHASWKVQTLQSEDAQTTDGYVIYSLHEINDGTRLCCEVVARCRILAPASVAGEDRIARDAAIGRAANESTLAKLDADHATLKRLIETGRT